MKPGLLQELGYREMFGLIVFAVLVDLVQGQSLRAMKSHIGEGGTGRIHQNEVNAKGKHFEFGCV